MNVEGVDIEVFYSKQYKDAHDEPLVSVICPAYNAERTIEKTIDSVANQTLDINQIELIVVDDNSNDSTLSLLHKCIDNFPRMIVAHLKNNTGGAGIPRNVGIALSTGKYTAFIDSDDWFAPKGLQVLTDILEESGDDYAVGKTLHVRDKSKSTVGKWQCDKERRNESAFEVPLFFYHMGPVGRIVRSSVIKDNGIRFLNLKFGEDKAFFFDVLSCCKSVATTKSLIYYQSRLSENKNSLTRILDTADKRSCDLEVLKHLLAKHLPEWQEKPLVTRILEYDFMKTFKSKTFCNAKDKDVYYDLLKKAFDIADALSWDYIQEMRYPMNRYAAMLFKDGRLDKFEQLFNWEVNENYKEFRIIDGHPYGVLRYADGEEALIEQRLLARFVSQQETSGMYQCIFEMHGELGDQVETIILKDKGAKATVVECGFSVIDKDKGLYAFEVSDAQLEKLGASMCIIAVKTPGYQLHNIKNTGYMNHVFPKGAALFYTTQYNNLSLKISTN